MDRSFFSFAAVRALPFVALLLFLWSVYPMSHYGLFYDPDGFMRLLRVEHLLETSHWYDSRIPRSNTPWGETSHWTRPLDVLLIAGASIGTLFTSFPHSLEIWGWLFSLSLLPLAAALLVWAYRPLLSQQNFLNDADLLLMTSLASLDFLLPFFPGRPDHHALLMLTALGQIGFTVRLLSSDPQPDNATGLGLCCGLGLWISVENLLVTILCCGALILRWTTDGSRLPSLLRVLSVFTVLTGVALLIERPPSELNLIEYDKICLFHLIALIEFCALFALMRLPYFAQFLRTSTLRGCLLFGGGLVAFGILTQLYPAWLRGPMADVPPRAFDVWLNAIGEVMPVLDGTPYGAARIITLIGLASLALGFTCRHFRVKTEASWSWILIAMGGLFFLALGLLQRRWLSYALLFLWIPLIPSVRAWIGTGEDRRKSALRKITLALSPWILLALGGLGDEWKSQVEKKPLPSREAGVTLHEAIRSLAQQPNLFPSGEIRIMTHLDYGPALLYYHPTLQVVATGYHRNAQGILDSYDFFRSTDFERARQMVEKRGITHVLVSRYRFEKEYFEVPRPQRSLHTWLLKNQPPHWLEKVDLPEELSREFTLYHVKTPTFFR